jgi:hypothetical protein
MIARLLQFAEQAEAYTAWSDRAGLGQLHKTPIGIGRYAPLATRSNE